MNDDQLDPERVVGCKIWLENQMRSWSATFRPDEIDLIAMAIAMEQTAQKIRGKLAGTHTPQPPSL
jgi:uncharacterized membrane protein